MQVTSTDNSNGAIKTYPVLLAGGTGTRLWPVSRERYPKQLVRFIGKDSLVQATIKRLSPVMPNDKVRIVCGEEHSHEIEKHIRDLGIDPDKKLIREPCGRNTAPAILLAVLSIAREERDAVICVFPADHVIKDISKFHEKLRVAIDLAGQGFVVTFGIRPGYPETGYGYIEGGEEIAHGALAIRRFVEKPDRETAGRYFRANNFFWNSGMFAFRISVILNEYKKFQPEMLQSVKEMVLTRKKVTKKHYQALTRISFDYAVMEKTDKGVILPSEFGWSDIGSWKSLYDFLPKDGDNNVIDGDVISRETKNSFIMGHDRLIATNRVDKMVVVETPDSILVSDIDTSQDVKSIVTTLKEAGRKEYQHHRRVHYQWGSRTLLEQRQGYRVTRLIINPGLSVQFHPEASLARHLNIIKGRATISTSDCVGVVQSGEIVTLSSGEGMDLKNDGDTSLYIIQVEIFSLDGLD
jgi:mannose-1-phosphate guanylyltransferase/mannose-6-phosphate isomerase